MTFYWGGAGVERGLDERCGGGHMANSRCLLGAAGWSCLSASCLVLAWAHSAATKPVTPPPATQRAARGLASYQSPEGSAGAIKVESKGKWISEAVASPSLPNSI